MSCTGDPEEKKEIRHRKAKPLPGQLGVQPPDAAHPGPWDLDCGAKSKPLTWNIHPVLSIKKSHISQKCENNMKIM